MNEKLLRILGKSRKSVWKLIEEWNADLNSFLKVLSEAYRKGEIEVEDGKVKLSENLRKLVKPRLKVKTCDKCKGRMINFYDKGLLKQFLKICKQRPHFKVKFFQGWMEPIDVIRRIALMDYFDGIADRSIALIGDDDLTSIALGLTNLPRRILALDIDKDLLSFIERISKKYGLQVETLEYNVANPLPKELVKKFDIFSSEPLETISGCLAFICRGASLLKGKGSVGYFGLSTTECPFKRWRIFEKEVLRMGFVITDIIRNFSEYPMYVEDVYEKTLAKRIPFPVKTPSDAYWFKSWLLRVEALKELKPKYPWNKKIRIKIVGKEDLTHPFSLQK